MSAHRDEHSRPPHVPSDYQGFPRQRFTAWSDGTRWRDLEDLLFDLLKQAESLLDYELKRHVHLVVYGSNAEARRSLDRAVPPTMLMAPRHTSDMALIAVQSPDVHALNGDRARMSRHLAHEIGHVLAAQRTGSTKQLGDENIHLKLQPWVDEGFAENLSTRLTNRPEKILKARDVAKKVTFTGEDLNAIFCNLQSPLRSDASALAEVLVADGIEKHGLRFVFDRLDSPQEWLVENRDSDTDGPSPKPIRASDGPSSQENCGKRSKADSEASV